MVLKTDALVKYTKYSLAGMTQVETIDGLISEIKPEQLAEKKDSRKRSMFNATAVTTRINAPS